MNKFLAVLVGIGTFFLGLLAIFVSGEKRGREKEQNNSIKKQLEQTDAIKKINDDVASTSTDDIRKRLRDEYAKN